MFGCMKMFIGLCLWMIGVVGFLELIVGELLVFVGVGVGEVLLVNDFGGEWVVIGVLMVLGVVERRLWGLVMGCFLGEMIFFIVVLSFFIDRFLCWGGLVGLLLLNKLLFLLLGMWLFLLLLKEMMLVGLVMVVFLFLIERSWFLCFLWL